MIDLRAVAQFPGKRAGMAAKIERARKAVRAVGQTFDHLARHAGFEKVILVEPGRGAVAKGEMARAFEHKRGRIGIH